MVTDKSVKDLASHEVIAGGNSETAHLGCALPSDEPPPINPTDRVQKPKTSTPFVVLVVVGIAVIVAVCWRPLSIQTITPYGPVIFPTLIAIWQFVFKDRDSYKPRWSRWVVLCCILGAGVWGINYQNQQLADRAESVGRALAAQKAQDENTKRFLGSFQDLSSQLNDLKIKFATKELQDQLAKVNGELEKTRSALTGPPPIEFQVSLRPLKATLPTGVDSPVTEITLPVGSDGAIHIPYFLYNPADRAAEKGDLTLVICDQCKYAKEPAGGCPRLS